MLTSYRDLVVWQKSIALVREIYRVSAFFPQAEVYGLTSQMRRAAVSIPSNIAEGYSRQHRQEYRQFLRIAFGFGAELETQLIIAQELGFVSKKECEQGEALLGEVMKMLNRLGSSLNPKP